VDNKPLSALELPKRKSSHFIFTGLWDSSASLALHKSLLEVPYLSIQSTISQYVLPYSPDRQF
jgi:hypothetical protein